MNNKLLWILTLSLAANVFFGTVIGLHLLRDPKGPPKPERLLERLAGALPPDDARILRDAMERHGVEEPADEGFEPRERLRQVLLAEPFDLAAFRQVHAELKASHERIGRIGDVMADAVPRMSPEGRRRLAEFGPPPRRK